VFFYDLIPKPRQNLVIIRPYSGVFLFLLSAAAKPKSQSAQGPDDCSAYFSVAPETAAESTHGSYHFFIYPSQLLLPDRKNGLTSVKSLHHHLDRFFPHFLKSHRNLPVSESVRKSKKVSNNFMDGTPPAPTLTHPFLLSFHISTFVRKHERPFPVDQSREIRFLPNKSGSLPYPSGYQVVKRIAA